MARVVSGVCQAASLLLLARSQTPEDFGLFSQVLSISYLLGGLLGFGLGTRALRLLAEDGYETTAKAMYVLRALSSAILIALAVGGFTATSSGPPVILFAAAGYVASEQVADLQQSLLSGQRRQALASWLIIARRLPPLVGIGIAISMGLDSFILFLIGVALTLFLPLIHAIRIPGWPWNSLWETLIASKGFWLANLATSLNQLDTTVVRTTSGLTTVGHYGAGNRISGPLNLISGSLMALYIPEMSASQSEQARRVIFKRMFVLILCSSIFIALASPVVGNAAVWLLGPSYEPARPLIMAFTIGAAISAVCQTFQAYSYALGHTRPVLIGSLINATVLLSGLFVLSAPLQEAGIALAIISAPLASLLWYVANYRSRRLPASDSDPRD